MTSHLEPDIGLYVEDMRPELEKIKELHGEGCILNGPSPMEVILEARDLFREMLDMDNKKEIIKDYKLDFTDQSYFPDGELFTRAAKACAYEKSRRVNVEKNQSKNPNLNKAGNGREDKGFRKPKNRQRP